MCCVDRLNWQLKTPYRNGTSHVIFEPVDFIANLAALVPKLQVNLTHYHNVLLHRIFIRVAAY
jgi:hypothetical protein